MDIELYIGEVIQKPSLKNTFILHVKSMSGDADEFHTNELHFEISEGTATLNRFLEYFVEYSKLDWNAQCYLCDGVLQHQSLERFSDIEDDLNELVGGDVTCDEGYARPDSVWVTYMDFVGLEHNVDIGIGDLLYSGIGRRGLREKENGTI